MQSAAGSSWTDSLQLLRWQRRALDIDESESPFVTRLRDQADKRCSPPPRPPERQRTQVSAMIDKNSSKSVCAPKSIWDPSGPVCYLPETFPCADNSDNSSSLSAPHTCDILMTGNQIAQLTGATAAGGADAEVQDAEDLSAFEVSPLVASHIGTGTHASALHTSTHNPRPCIPSLRVPAVSPPSRIISPCLRPPFSKRPDLTLSCRKATSGDLDLDISLSTNSFFSPSSAQVSPSSSWTNDDPENTGQRSNDKRYTYIVDICIPPLPFGIQIGQIPVMKCRQIVTQIRSSQR